ncbi:hypothetical protein BaRGS_00023615 [Batillaria attramentaria]|uniref:Uncharacterized protein n=1 Tax=Batillaria attramentaria TaxID=370345 RepID=A0ABD0KDL9_9CAEN
MFRINRLIVYDLDKAPSAPVDQIVGNRAPKISIATDLAHASPEVTKRPVAAVLLDRFRAFNALNTQKARKNIRVECGLIEVLTPTAVNIFRIFACQQPFSVQQLIVNEEAIGMYEANGSQRHFTAIHSKDVRASVFWQRMLLLCMYATF